LRGGGRRPPGSFGGFLQCLQILKHVSFAPSPRERQGSTDGSPTSAPIILSHSHLQSEYSQHPRLITVEHARLVASTGGVIGAWPSGFANRTFADFVDQTMRLVDAVGVDHVGLGTDMDGNF
jgi:microsomal dipeptidase-like Zn-dependent dipeptidase